MPHAGRRHFAVFLAVLLAALAVLFERTWRLGEVFSPADAIEIFFPWAYDETRPAPANLTRTDEAFFHQPLMMTHWARLKAGDFPEWDPLILSGTPAFFQGLDTGRAFSPMSLPFYVAPPELAVTLYAPLRLLCAGVFMWLFLRHRGHGPWAAAAGGLAFGLNGAFIAWLSAPMPTVALFLPLVLLGVDRAALGGSAREVALLGLAIGCALLGAYLPTSLAVLAATGVYALDALWQSRRARAAARLAIGAAIGLALSAVALAPMLANLLHSPVSGRSMLRRTLPWTNLATFALPDVWGSPLSQNWWYPGEANYPEFVTYLGVVAVALAGAGLAAATRARDRRTLVIAGLALFSLAMMYGWPPASWVAPLPGFKQMNPFRWNVVLACGVAVLVATGVDALSGLRRRGRDVEGHSSGSEDVDVGPLAPDAPTVHLDRWWALAGLAVALGAMATAAGAALWSHVDLVRRANLQAFEKAQVMRFAALSAAVLAVAASMAAAGLVRSRAASVRPAATPERPGRAAAVAAVALALLVAADLVWFAHGFNPTIARDRLYPTRPGIERLRAETGQGRSAAVDPRTELVPGHIWSVFGIEAVTGFDFFGDAAYQRLIDRVTQPTPGPARWDHVKLDGPNPPDLRLLGLLNATTIVTSPVDVVSRGFGFATLGELTDGRQVRQGFSTPNPTRAVDVLVGTYARRNAGSLTIALQGAAGEIVARREVEAASLGDNAWLRLEVPGDPPSGPLTIVVEPRGARPGSAVTLWTTGAPALPSGGLTVAGGAVAGALVFRTFSPAPRRFAGADLVYSADLNIYRNRLALPRAWFVEAVEVAALEHHLDRLAATSFDPARTALVTAPLAVSPPPSARVLSIDTSHPDRRRIAVDAPAGGLLVVSERYAGGWHAISGDARLAIHRADSVLMAVEIPAGAREVLLEYDTPTLPWSLAVSGLAALGIALAAATGGRWHRRRAARPAATSGRRGGADAGP